MAKKTFEQTMEELEQVVRQLENGDIPLEESLDLFVQGLKQTKSCQTNLDSAEKKVSMLV